MKRDISQLYSFITDCNNEKIINLKEILEYKQIKKIIKQNLLIYDQEDP